MNMSNNKRWGLVVFFSLIIFATLPFARNAWDFIGDKNAYIMLLGMYCVSAGYIYYRYKKLYILALLFIFTAVIFKLIPLPIERIHFVQYGLLGWMAYWAAGKHKWAFFIALIYVVTIGVLDEVIQGILPNRYFDWRDIWMNIIGGCLGLGFRNYAR